MQLFEQFMQHHIQQRDIKQAKSLIRVVVLGAVFFSIYRAAPQCYTPIALPRSREASPDVVGLEQSKQQRGFSTSRKMHGTA